MMMVNAAQTKIEEQSSTISNLENGILCVKEESKLKEEMLVNMDKRLQEEFEHRLGNQFHSQKLIKERDDKVFDLNRAVEWYEQEVDELKLELEKMEKNGSSNKNIKSIKTSESFLNSIERKNADYWKKVADDRKTENDEIRTDLRNALKKKQRRL